ncbi:hypothetical protein KC367_g74 [Hortaea werneckii]|nr:hypothetical protein KC367_g74 [Hortaea werneckii]
MKVRWFASQTFASTFTGPWSLIQISGLLTPGGKACLLRLAFAYLLVEKPGKRFLRPPAKVLLRSVWWVCSPVSSSSSSSTVPSTGSDLDGRGADRGDDAFLLALLVRLQTPSVGPSGYLLRRAEQHRARTWKTEVPP